MGPFLSPKKCTPGQCSGVPTGAQIQSYCFAQAVSFRNPRVFLSAGKWIIQTVLWDFQEPKAQFKTTTRRKTEKQIINR